MALYRIRSDALGKLTYVYEAKSEDEACDMFWEDEHAFALYERELYAKFSSAKGDGITADEIVPS